MLTSNLFGECPFPFSLPPWTVYCCFSKRVQVPLEQDGVFKARTAALGISKFNSSTVFNCHGNIPKKLNLTIVQLGLSTTLDSFFTAVTNFFFTWRKSAGCYNHSNRCLAPGLVLRSRHLQMSVRRKTAKTETHEELFCIRM